MAREETIANGLSPARVRAARAEECRFDAFRCRFGASNDAETVALYLAFLAEEHSGPAVRRRLQSLDLARRLHGDSPWSENRDVRSVLRGLFAASPVGPDGPGCFDPLYLGLMHALVDATRVPTIHQRRAVAAMILVEGTGLPVAVLARLTWDQVRVTKQRVVVKVSRRVGRGHTCEQTWELAALKGKPSCPVCALRQVRGGRFVLVEKEGAWDRDRLRTQLSPLLDADPGPRRLLPALVRALSPSPSQVRDCALLTVGYGAGLRTREVTLLRQRDVALMEEGLTLRVEGRRYATHVPRSANPQHDAVTAWEAWLACLRSRDLAEPHRPAFLVCNQRVIEPTALASAGLNLIVHQRCQQAGLDGRFVWTSLRTGMMRTAIRNDAAEWAVARQADLRSLGSVRRHERRETLLSHNVTAMLGM